MRHKPRLSPVGAILLLQVVTNISVDAQNSLKISESNFKDPKIWDVNSLYMSSKLMTNLRNKRSIAPVTATANSQTVDACQSKMEIITPYHATNSKGKLRTIVNSELMQQAIQVETCVRSPTNNQKCNAHSDCGCEQKYKWHRLLVLDPQNAGVDKGLFMDWFLFPSSCVCRCKSSPPVANHKQLLRAIKSS